MITKVKYDKAVQAFLKALGYDPADVVEFHATAGSPITVHVLANRNPYRVRIDEVVVQPAARKAPEGDK